MTAAHAGRFDGAQHARVVARCDPHAAFARRKGNLGLPESDRAAYVAAYLRAYAATGEQIQAGAR